MEAWLGYTQVLKYLYSLTDYEKDRTARYDPETLDLSRVESALQALDNPHRKFLSIHIAGTKGKGSTAAICASVLRTTGLRTGLYTSPHLHSFRERIQVDGELISIQDLLATLHTCRPVFDSIPGLTTFEAMTVLAFTHFAQRQVDWAVLEVGLGGRLDATNVVTPQVAVITSLSYDHIYWLGTTLAQIAYEKAGIVKSGVPTVCEPEPIEAKQVIQQVCTERSSPLTLIGEDWSWQPGEISLEGQKFTLFNRRLDSPLAGEYWLPLPGRHQLNNAAAAIAALDVLRKNGLSLNVKQVRQGLASVKWPGRFEILREQPPLVVDCAHNGDSATKLATALEDWFPGLCWTVIFGASNDKDIDGMLQALAPQATRLLATRSSHSRAMAPEQIVERARQVQPHLPVEPTDSVAGALNHALSRGDEALCVTGSVFVAAEAREAWLRHLGEPLPAID